MKISQTSKNILKLRKEHKLLSSQGYRKHETDYEIIRGTKRNEIILDVKISSCKKYIYTKIGTPSHLTDEVPR